MDNATLSLMNDPIFWTFLLLGVACLFGTIATTWQPKRRRLRDLPKDEWEGFDKFVAECERANPEEMAKARLDVRARLAGIGA